LGSQGYLAAEEYQEEKNQTLTIENRFSGSQES
jgi:hypothetical protein